MKGIEYKTSPPTFEEYFQLFSSTGWMPILRVSESESMIIPGTIIPGTG